MYFTFKDTTCITKIKEPCKLYMLHIWYTYGLSFEFFGGKRINAGSQDRGV